MTLRCHESWPVERISILLVNYSYNYIQKVPQLYKPWHHFSFTPFFPCKLLLLKISTPFFYTYNNRAKSKKEVRIRFTGNFNPYENIDCCHFTHLFPISLQLSWFSFQCYPQRCPCPNSDVIHLPKKISLMLYIQCLVNRLEVKKKTTFDFF